jgi:amino acid adenylation domain-containing protein
MAEPLISDEDRPTPKAATLIELLRWRAFHQPERRSHTFLDDGESDEIPLTYAELDHQARAIAAVLQRDNAAGQRVLLLYPPGPAYIAGFFGCLYAGAIAVPAYPPDIDRLNRTLPRLRTIVADAQATFALTTADILSLAEYVFDEAPDLKALSWLATDALTDDAADNWHAPAVTRDALAFLQYTSGSTRDPRGVKLSHANLLHNSALIAQAFDVKPDSVGMVWLPPYHDMGLIGGILQPIYSGVPCVLMSPISFLQHPLRWLQAISQYRATISGGPNFAYDLCVRKITAEQRSALDLSRWAVAFNGAEPVRSDTLDRFVAAFEPCGFRREAFFPCYGLAEATLIVSGGLTSEPPVIRAVQKTALERHHIVGANQADGNALSLIGCGRPLGDLDVVIVDPAALTPCPINHIGEIWATGPSVAGGYWNQADETRHTFQARLANGDPRSFLRTGDLGFMSGGELFITGRRKDLIILRGRNLYPQDIEFSVEQSHPALRPGCGAAFAVDANGEERLVVVQEVDTRRSIDPAELAATIRQAVAEAYDVQVYAVVLIEPRSIPKTSSGKIQRHACQAEYLAGTLNVIESSILDGSEETTGPAELTRAALLAAGPAQRQALLEVYLRSRLAALVHAPFSQVAVGQSLSSLGLDSVMIIDLASELETVFGISLPVSTRLQTAAITELAAQILNELAQPAAAPKVSEPAAVAYPLTAGQRALWFVQQLSPDSGAYSMAYAVRIHSDLAVAALKRAFDRIIERHPALRTTFAVEHSEPIQLVHDHLDSYFANEDAARWTEEELHARLAREVYRPFDLAAGPLVRVLVLTRAPREHILLLTMHHIISDMWSVTVLLYEVGQLYQAEASGTPVALKPLAVSYAAYVRQQAELLNSAESDRLWAYWRDQLLGELPVLDLLPDRPRPPVQTYHGAAQTLRLNAELTRQLADIAKAHGSALHVLLLAAFEVLLSRYSGQGEFLIGYPKANRTQQWSPVIGYFVNSVPLRVNVADGPTFTTLIERTRQVMLAAFQHDAYPFPLLVERLQPARDLSRSPLFQVMFAWQKTTHLLDDEALTSLALSEPGRRLTLGGLSLEALPLQQRVVPFDLSLLMGEAGAELVALLEYNTDLFEADTVTRMLGHFQTLLENIVIDPTQAITQLSLITAAEEHQLLVEWQAAQLSDRPAPFIHHQVEAQADRTPEASAVALDREQLTYRELNRRANQLARHLQQLGVGPEVLVGLCVERSLDMIVGLLGILKAGGAYVPLDPAYPPERLAFMLNDARIRVVVTHAQLAERLPHADLRCVCLDVDRAALDAAEAANPIDHLSPGDLAYVLYTSGSTGEPKGVLITHAAIADHCRDVTRHFELTANDRVLQFASLNFDASLEQIITALSAGATLHVRGPELLSGRAFNQFVARLQLTVVNVPPAYWQEWLQAWSRPDGLAPNPQLRLVIVGGDVVLPEQLRAWRQTPLGKARCLNAYGPTETTITAATFEVPAQLDEVLARQQVPIGRPLPNRTAYILDPAGQLTPIGMPGELQLGGLGLARGYLNHPGLTAEKFVTNPFNPTTRLYRTGDLARYRYDGQIEFLGRIDNQVKIRGMRVELGEIEAALTQHPAVREAVVVWRAEQQLAAYVVLCQAQPLADLRSWLKDRLPGHMLPNSITSLEALPIGVSGKVDRRALPEPVLQPSAGMRQFVAPRTPAEEAFAQIWRELLQVDRVGVDDNFFELGGHSLLATQLVSRLRDVFEVEVPVRSVFEAPTIAQLAVVIAQRQAEQAADQADIDRLLAELEELSDAEAQRLLARQMPEPLT